MGLLSFNLPEHGEPRSTADGKVREGLSKIKETINGELDHTNLSASAEITKAQLSSEAKPVTWYTPKIIATEETRTSTEYGTMPTPDEIKSVVLPENGLICVAYRAIAKSTVSAAGNFALFLGSNQAKAGTGGTSPEARSANITGTNFKPIGIVQSGPEISGVSETWGGDVTTGQYLIPTLNSSPYAVLFAAAGTYNVAVKFKASSGSVMVKERKLWVATFGT